MEHEKLEREVVEMLAERDMTLDVEKVRQLAQLVSELEIAEIELETPLGYIRISKYPEQVQVSPPPPPPPTVAAPPPPPPAERPVEPEKAEKTEPAAAEPPVDETLHEIKSPIVGTFYRAPAPGEAPFVEVGDHVNPGDVLCIVEAMKVMNQIKSDISGTIVEILPKNGEPVEYGQVLFRIKPD